MIAHATAPLPDRLRALALRRLATMYRPSAGLFAFRVRPRGGDLVVEGHSRRYTAIALIGLATESDEVVANVLDGDTAPRVCRRLLADIGSWDNLGDVALALWAARRLGLCEADDAFRRLVDLAPAERTYPSVEVAWALAALSVDPNEPVGAMSQRLACRLMGSLREGVPVFPHVLGDRAGPRSHVSCFADFVYPVHALALYVLHSRDDRALHVAARVADHFCRMQGEAGQWWWHYDNRTGAVIEGYPVYAVHQDAMAPMALRALQEAGGADYSRPIANGLRWLAASPELGGQSLIDWKADVVWRKVGRCEPRKVSRYLRAAAARVRPGLGLRALDVVFPPTSIDREDRPYHLGWLLHVWSQSQLAVSLREPSCAFATQPATTTCARTAIEARTIFGIPIAAVTQADVIARVDDAITERSQLQIGAVNAAKIVHMRRDQALRRSVLASDLIVADGMAVVWASRWLGCRLPERVAGIDLMMAMLARADQRGYRVYCLGATAEVVALVAARISRDFPRLHLVGYRDGYFTPCHETDVAAAIAASRPDILLVAMTSPKKERFLARWSPHMRVPVCHGVGGSFDVLAGKVQRAPERWQRLGFEWLYRVKQEPRRLWRRYLVTNVLFCAMFVREFLERLHGPTTVTGGDGR